MYRVFTQLVAATAVALSLATAGTAVSLGTAGSASAQYCQWVALGQGGGTPLPTPPKPSPGPAPTPPLTRVCDRAGAPGVNPQTNPVHRTP